jgi:nitroimidazol reductase NimA-like FMN-containing flavoprotein (pyridoxamine 5'-phosphate oxidase superfamily)
LEDIHEMKDKVRDLFEAQKLAVLSTQRGGQPYTTLVAFAASPDLKYLYFATTRATRKYANLSADARVAMLMDNRSNEVADFRRAMAVTAVGRAEEVDDQERDAITDIYLAKHPHLRDFVKSPTCALLSVGVSTYYVVNRFQEVREIHLKK